MMKSRSALAAVLTLGLVTACGESDTEPTNQEGNLTQDVGTELQDVSESTVLSLNEDGLAAKLAVIDRAQAGDSLDLSYYLLSDDESSAFMASRLIAAAHRGVKVRVILDFFTNFSRWHYYHWIQYHAKDGNSSGGSVEFRFYNIPSPGIREDVRFMVTPCSLEGELITSDACTADRKANQNTAEAFRKQNMFLTGLYGKSNLALEASMAEVAAQYEAVGEAGGETSDEDKAAAMAGLKLIYQARTGDVGAKIAVFFLAGKLAPLSAAFDSLNPGGSAEHKEEWAHLTDFTHQKLTLLTGASGESEMVLGGRNVENSYHVSELGEESAWGLWDEAADARTAWASKYIFMDTDVHTVFRGDSVRKRFENLWNFNQMVVPLIGIGSDLGTDPGLSFEVEGETVHALDRYGPEYVATVADRFSQRYDYDANAATVTPKQPTATYQQNVAGMFPRFDLEGERYYYVENIPNANGTREFSTSGDWANEKAHGKNIHQAWHDSLAKQCASSEAKEVVIHNAYLMLPTHFQRSLYEAIREPDTCKGVSKFIIATNSLTSTDLNIINVFNESYIKPILDNAPSGRLEYYEYTTADVSASNPISRSLHTKAMIFGDDVYIGSSNADGRSKFMDANNGIFVEDAPAFVAEYKGWLMGKALPALGASDPHGIKSMSPEQLQETNMQFLETHIFDRWLKNQEALRPLLSKWARDTIGQLYNVTNEVMPKDPSKTTSLQHTTLGEVDKGATNEEVMILTDKEVELL